MLKPKEQRFCPPITFLSPDNGGTEGGTKTIEEPKGVQRPLKQRANVFALCRVASEDDCGIEDIENVCPHKGE